MENPQTTREATAEFYAFRIREMTTLITSAIESMTPDDLYKLFRALKESKIEEIINNAIRD